MKKNLGVIVLTLFVMFVFASCTKTDIIGNTSITAFDKVLNAIPDNISEDDKKGTWSLAAPDNSAEFIWSYDFSNRSEYDIMIKTDARPFIEAGLDVDKLPSGMYYNDKIVIGTKLNIDSTNNDMEATPLSSYEKIVRLSRDSLTYHSAMDHFGIDLTNGNVFEWAKDMSKNDKDIVFALDPRVFIDAGVDPLKVEGWEFKEISTMNEYMKPIKAEKLLKIFNLE